VPLFSDFNIIHLYYDLYQYNWTSCFNTQLKLFLKYIFAFQILCKYSWGLFYLKIHMYEGMAHGQYWLTSHNSFFVFFCLFVTWSKWSYELLSPLCIHNLYTSHFNLLPNLWANWIQTYQGCSLEGSTIDPLSLKTKICFFFIRNLQKNKRPQGVIIGIFCFFIGSIYF